MKLGGTGMGMAAILLAMGIAACGKKADDPPQVKPVAPAVVQDTPASTASAPEAPQPQPVAESPEAKIARMRAQQNETVVTDEVAKQERIAARTQQQQATMSGIDSSQIAKLPQDSHLGAYPYTVPNASAAASTSASAAASETQTPAQPADAASQEASAEKRHYLKRN